MSIDMTINCEVCLKSYKTRTTFNRHICNSTDNSVNRRLRNE